MSAKHLASTEAIEVNVMNTKHIIIFMILLSIFAISVSAVTVNLDPLNLIANNSNLSSSSVVFNVNVTLGNTSTYTCKLFSNENTSNGAGTWREIETNSGVVNNTLHTNFSSVTLADSTGYLWNVFCNATVDGAGNWSATGNRTFTIDTTAPSITQLYPSGDLVGINSTELWVNNASGRGNLKFVFNITDLTPAQCTLYMNFNISTNASSVNISQDIAKYTNATALNFTRFNASFVNFPDNNTGMPWSVQCNDSAGNTASTGNSFKVDTTLPGAFDFNVSLFRTDNRLLFNDTLATDFTPQVGWGSSAEPNFHRFEVNFYVGAYGSLTGLVQTNVTTSNSTFVVNSSLLLANTHYVINVTAFDLAGNQKSISTIGWNYTTIDVNRLLRSGWNFLGNPGEIFTLSSILNWTGADTVSVWNATHKFQSHVSGGSNGGVNVHPGEVVLVHISADQNFSDIVYNATATVNPFTGNTSVTITNQSASDWNLVMQEDFRDDISLQRLDTYLNCQNGSTPGACGNIGAVNNMTNVSFFSLYNNSASSGAKYIPYVANWSINNATVFKFSQAIWLFKANDGAQNQTLNWSAIN